eukprot:Gb_02040 [translate_table: standard]
MIVMKRSRTSQLSVAESHAQVFLGSGKNLIRILIAAIPLSEDHKPNRSDERERIEQAGGNVMWAGTWRVGGVLAVSRAFGNRLLKQYVVAEPEIQEAIVDEDLEFLVLASDGLWDVVSNEDAISLVKSIEDPEVAARNLTETAYTKGSVAASSAAAVEVIGRTTVNASGLSVMHSLHVHLRGCAAEMFDSSIMGEDGGNLLAFIHMTIPRLANQPWVFVLRVGGNQLINQTKLWIFEAIHPDIKSDRSLTFSQKSHAIAYLLVLTTNRILEPCIVEPSMGNNLPSKWNAKGRMLSVDA